MSSTALKIFMFIRYHFADRCDKIITKRGFIQFMNRLSIRDFSLDKDTNIIRKCPACFTPLHSGISKGQTVAYFSSEKCEKCANLNNCICKKQPKNYVVRVSLKALDDTHVIKFSDINTDIKKEQQNKIVTILHKYKKVVAVAVLCLFIGTGALIAGALYDSDTPITIDSNINASIGMPLLERISTMLENPPQNEIQPDTSTINTQENNDNTNSPDNTLPLNNNDDNSDTSNVIKNNDVSGDDEVELPYLIYVSKNSYTIAILGLDDDGEYTQLIQTYNTAVGRTSAQTRAGTYTIVSRTRWIVWDSANFTPYGVRHSGGLWFHGPMFSSMNSTSLRARSYNEIGTSASAGCMRTFTAAAAWIYYNVPDGTTVIIANDSLYTSTQPNSIPSTQNYDPTDPHIQSRTVGAIEEQRDLLP